MWEHSGSIVRLMRTSKGQMTMSRTRAVKVNTKIGIVATLRMIKQANDSGYGVPGAAVYGCLTRKEVMYICESGLVCEQDSAYMRHMGAGNMFYISDAGREFIQC